MPLPECHSRKFHFSGNPSPSLRISPHASESEPRPQDLGSGRAGRHIHTYPCVLLYEYKEIVFTFLPLLQIHKNAQSESSARNPTTNHTPLRFAQLHRTLRLRECIRKHNGQHLNECHSQNATSINCLYQRIALCI